MSKMSVLMGTVMGGNKTLALSSGSGALKAEAEEHKGNGETRVAGGGGGGGGSSDGEKLPTQLSHGSCYESDEEHEDEYEHKHEHKHVVGPLLPLKHQLEKDKEDESLRRWKEQLLGSLDIETVGEHLEPDVKIQSIGILSAGRPDLILPIPFVPSNSRGSSFTLKEGSHYRLKICFSVSGNIVSGLTYVHTVWKSGVRVDNTRVMLGTFSPQQEPYTYVMEEEKTPSGIFARGTYSARTKFVDDDQRCHLEINYTFEIRKDW